MKRIYLILLLIFLVPAIAFANDQKVTFYPSDTQLQGKPAVVCETPYYRIMLPADLNYESEIKENETLFEVTGIATKDKDIHYISIITKPLGEENENELCEWFINKCKKETIPTGPKVEVRDLYFSGFKCKEISGFVSINDFIFKNVNYLVIKNDKVFVLMSIHQPRYTMESDKPFLTEVTSSHEALLHKIMNTLEIK